MKTLPFPLILSSWVATMASAQPQDHNPCHVNKNAPAPACQDVIVPAGMCSSCRVDAPMIESNGKY